MTETTSKKKKSILTKIKNIATSDTVRVLLPLALSILRARKGK